MPDQRVPVLPRIGMLSFAHYHANFWSEVFAARGLLAGVWDDDCARGEEAAKRYGVAYYPDLAALLAVCSAVAVCSETARHPALIQEAAQRGLAVLTEKPIAASLADGDRIARTVREHGIVFMQSFPKRFDPVSHYLKTLVDTRALGRLSLVRIRHGHFYGLDPDFRHRWYVQPDLAGGGALLDEGIHGADLLGWLFGMPQSVTAVISDAALGLPVEDLGIATYTFAGGLLAELTASFSFAAADVSIEMYGSGGTVLVAGVDLASRDITSRDFVRIHRRNGPLTANSPPRWETVALTPRFKLGEFHQQNAIAFADCLMQGTPTPITLDDGLRALRMIDAAYRAARSGQRQELLP